MLFTASCLYYYYYLFIFQVYISQKNVTSPPLTLTFLDSLTPFWSVMLFITNTGCQLLWGFKHVSVGTHVHVSA